MLLACFYALSEKNVSADYHLIMVLTLLIKPYDIIIKKNESILHAFRTRMKTV